MPGAGVYKLSFFAPDQRDGTESFAKAASRLVLFGLNFDELTLLLDNSTTADPGKIVKVELGWLAG